MKGIEISDRARPHARHALLFGCFFGWAKESYTKGFEPLPYTVCRYAVHPTGEHRKQMKQFAMCKGRYFRQKAV